MKTVTYDEVVEIDETMDSEAVPDTQVIGDGIVITESPTCFEVHTDPPSDPFSDDSGRMQL